MINKRSLPERKRSSPFLTVSTVINKDPGITTDRNSKRRSEVEDVTHTACMTNFLTSGYGVHSTVTGGTKSKNIDYILLYFTNVGEVCGKSHYPHPYSCLQMSYRHTGPHFCCL